MVKKNRMRFLLVAVGFFWSVEAWAFELPVDSGQCLVATAAGWDSSTAVLRLYEKAGGDWREVGGPWSARLGKNGLVWGLGLHPLPKGASSKREGDFRTPAGVFRIGGVWGYAPEGDCHSALPYHQITTRDLWVEDSSSPDYNNHVRLAADPATAWEKKQQMKQGDPAHALKLFIAHNAVPRAVPGAGSAIFFHIWRGGGSRPTAGCTTLAEPHLRSLIAALKPEKNPLYVILPADDYSRLRREWKLP